jgi:hypothetical protein
MAYYPGYRSTAFFSYSQRLALLMDLPKAAVLVPSIDPTPHDWADRQGASMHVGTYYTQSTGLGESPKIG